MTRKKKTSKVIDLLFRMGVFDVMHALWPPRLTVLAYHRIADPQSPNFDTFKPNVSATPADFAAQMDFVHRYFKVISSGEVSSWLKSKKPLPANAALVTFDDGYRDNFEHALPVLRERNLPALIFLATDHIDSDSPFDWDLVAYCFRHTRQSEVDLPLGGRKHWHSEESRSAVMVSWLNALKQLPDEEKREAVGRLPDVLQVTVPDDAFLGLHLSWDQVRRLVAAGVDMGAHTKSHPILTRIPLAQARAEIVESKTRIEAEIEQTVTAFAYPNGLPNDFNSAIENMVQQVGYEAAFTLVPGPTLMATVRRSPMTIRRTFISHKDDLSRFAAKVMGVPRLLGRPR
jgi:peptidoglycan/xylan/chitin deacetylase (PgdA/CDA1 family)